jgi:transcriptional regulator with XRE-family HTH domain
MKQTELCERSNVSKSSLSEYLSGKHIPNQQKIFVLAQALGVDPVWLWGYDVPMETPIKISPDKIELTEGEMMMLSVFRLIPEEQQRAFLEMGRAYANSLKKD